LARLRTEAKLNRLRDGEYRCMQNLVRFLEFAESLIKISGKSSKVQNKKTEIVKSTSLPSLMP